MAVSEAQTETAAEPAELQLDPRLDLAPLAAVFSRFGRAHIPGVLARTSAIAMYRSVASEDIPWQTHYNDGAAVFDIPAAQVDALPAEDRNALLRPLYARARLGFQYLYDSFALSDHHARGEHLELPIMRAYEFISSPAMIDFARRLTGIREISSVDAQATRYRPGDFLTAHDDRDESKGRVAAYVLSLTPGWRPDWGGILQFLDRDGHVAEGYAPAFNSLNIFRVPLLHSVSFVAPFAGESRLSITGWFRR